MSAEEKREQQAALRHLEDLIESLDQVQDPAARESARELVELILDLHSVALARLIAVVTGSEGGATILARLAEDDRVRPLLLLHSLHPEDVETRVRRAAERLRPHLGVLGLRLEIVRIDNGKARLQVRPSDGATVKASLLWTLPMEIEAAIVEAAPDIEEVVIDGLDPPGMAAATPAASN